MTHALIKQHAPASEMVERLLDEILAGKDLDLLMGYQDLKPVSPTVGTIVKGRVVDIKDKSVLIDFGHKSEGILPYKEEDMVNDDLDVGDEVNVLIAKVTEEDVVTLTRKNVELMLQQQQVVASLKVGQLVYGKLLERNKSGWLVDLDGLRAFLPSTQEYLIYPADGTQDSLAGLEIEAEVAAIDDKNVTLTREPFATEVKRLAKDYFLSNLQIGSVVDGVIKNATDFGLFIQIASGVIGLCYSSDKGSDPIKVGDTVKCKILKFDKEKNRVTLGIRQVNEPSWVDAVSKFTMNDRVVGEVKSLVPYGAFLEIEPGVSGLVHVSDLSWSEHVKHPKEALTIGQKVEVVILGIDPEKEHLSLGLKQITPDPWLTVMERFLVGASVAGRVVNKTKFGVFVEIEKGVEGLAHHTVTSKSLKVDDVVEVTIIRIDPLTKRITLALD